MITYAGGPVVKQALLHTAFWGAAWDYRPQHAQMAEIKRFHQDLLNSPFMNVLTQYGALGVGSGAVAKSTVLREVPKVLTEDEYRNIISRAFLGALPRPQDGRSTVLLIYLDEDTIINDPTSGRQLNFSAAFASGYHDHLVTPAGLPVYYGFVAYSRDTTEMTVIASHEFAEVLTDPEYNAWTPDGGNTEIADICDGRDIVTVGDTDWVVQPIWSNLHGRCICQTSYPLPELQGPGSAPANAQASALGSRRGWGPRRS